MNVQPEPPSPLETESKDLPESDAILYLLDVPCQNMSGSPSEPQQLP